MVSDLKGVSGNFITKVRKIQFCKEKKIRKYMKATYNLFLFITWFIFFIQILLLYLIKTGSVNLLT